MKVNPQEFAQHVLPGSIEKMKLWLGGAGSNQPKILALFLGCDLVKNLKEASQPAWPVLFPVVLAGLTDKDASVRTPCAYCIGLAAPLASFAEAAPQCFKVLGQIVSSPAPKKRDDQAKMAMDNCVSAL